MIVLGSTNTISVTYDTSADQLEYIPILIRQAIEAQGDARFDRAHFQVFGAFSLNFEAVYFVMKPDFNLFMDVQQAINVQLVRSFAEQHIQFAFTAQTPNVNQLGQIGPAPASKGLVPPH